MKRINCFGFACTLALIATAVPAEEVRKLSAEPRRSQPIGETTGRLDFQFGETRAWLLPDGSWHIEGMVPHRGARCGTYRLGMQFGTGNPGCANVRWITEESYGSYEVQCNNASVRHVGGGQSPLAAGDFEAINCGQRLLECSGSCR